MSATLLLVQLLDGLQYGVLLFLLAAGLTLVFGIMSFVNLAHGSLYMLGAYAGALAGLDLRRTLGVPVQTLQASEIAALEPALEPIFVRGALFGGSWHLSDPAGFLQTLQRYLQAQGLQWHAHAATALRPGPQAVRLVCADHESAYDYVALCAGVHSKALAAQCGDPLPLGAERGYHWMFAGGQNLISRPVGWAERGFYMTPMAQGVRVAGTVELAGLAPQKHAGLLELLQSQVNDCQLFNGQRFFGEARHIL